MTTLSEYLEGVMRVPLGLLTSDGFSECPASFSDGASVSDFKRFLNNCTQPITGIVSPQKLQEMLGELVVTRHEFQQTIKGQEPLSNARFQIDCLIGEHCLKKAKQLLGPSYMCIVRIYGIPPELPGRFSDGEICRQVLLLYRKQPSEAQRWLERLSRGKRKHVTMVFHRKGIWSAMEDVALFTGLWDDIKLGNWAKHLAAHIDEQIQTYWKHIYQVWDSQIFAGIDPGLRQHLDAPSARFLQFMTPAWSERDQKAIRKRMKSGSLFCNVSDEEVRSRLLRNILGFKGVIPSVLTFHENMRYLTVGAKILEKHIEVKRSTVKAGPDLAPAKIPESLFANLQQDWGKDVTVQNHVEYCEGQYRPIRSPSHAHLAFVQLILAALRWFPFLSSEAPLQDVKGLGMPAYADDYHRRRLCSTARSLGFSNKMIEEGLALPDLPKTREMPDFLPLCAESAWRGWRGGLPTIRVFEELSTKSFLPTLNSAAREIDKSEPESILIQSDLINAFFGSCDVILCQIFEVTPQSSTVAPNFDAVVDMDWSQAETTFQGEQAPTTEQTFQAEEAPTTEQASSPAYLRPKTQKRDKRRGIVASSKVAFKSKHDGRDEGNIFINIAKPSFGKRKMAKTRRKKRGEGSRGVREIEEAANVGDGSSPEPMQEDQEPDVPEPHQRMSAPTVDAYDVSLQSENQSNSHRRGHETQGQDEYRGHLQERREQEQSQQYTHTEQNQQVQDQQVHESTGSQVASPVIPNIEQRISAPNVEGYNGSSSRTPLQHKQHTASQSRSRNYHPIYRMAAETQRVEINKKNGPDGDGYREVKRLMTRRVMDDSDPVVPERTQDPLDEAGPDEEEL